jgi:hypothetical protein
MLRSLLFSAATLLLILPANAGITTFFGQDQFPNNTVPPGGNAANARASFLGALSGGVGTETFESFNDGTNVPINLTFPGSTGSITATLNGNPSDGIISVAAGQNSAGRFNTTPGGTKLLQTGGGNNFDISFSSPIAAFGFYGTDIGDFAGNLVLTLSNGPTETFTLNTGGSQDANLLFWGFVDDTNTYTNITFQNTSGSDFFGFDDMTIGDAGQVLPPGEVPEPGSVAIFGLLGLAGFVGTRRRRSNKTA